ncbi:MAG: hydrogenase iron-sulfur subunit [Candidatus Bathyarchaeia archaeon]
MSEPRIVAFLCRWCAYAGADLAGTTRKHYDPNLISIRVIEEGYDGILIAGCHPGTCHYINGNYKALRRFTLLRKLLRQMCVPDERVRLEWISASESDKFVTIVNEMIENLRKLEPAIQIRPRT